MITRKNIVSKIAGLICVIIIMNVQSSRAQSSSTYDKLVDFLPPAPNAASIIKYGDATVNKNTGAPNISIPLFTVKGTKLSADVSLGYSSTGIRVDEIASSAGMGWAINAGGVITRTLRGVPDEWNVRHHPYGPIGVNWNTLMYMRRIAESQSTWGNHNGYDAEPDVFNFSFNGYSGSFVFDYYLNIIQINKTGLKIEKNVDNAVWNFKITTPDGIVYFFGGSTAVEKTKRDQTCGKTYTEYIPNAWYLKEIQHLNGEKIVFTYTPHTYAYDNGVTQTMFDPGFSGVGSGCVCAHLPTTICTNLTRTSGVLLQSIESPGKSAVTFEYVSRDDSEDKLISKINFKNPATTISYYDLIYSTVTSNATYNSSETYNGINKTPYLTELKEAVPGITENKRHYFSYNDPEGRPSRLSFSQDHWGYFNGKTNTSLVPDLGVWYNLKFPDAKADREPNFPFSQKGLLQKIVYPTGGISTLFYEPNMYEQTDVHQTLHKLSCDVTGTGDWVVQSKSINFHKDNLNEQARIQVHCRVNNGSSPPYNHHNKGNVSIVNTATSQIVFQKNYSPNDNLTDDVFLAEGDYTLFLDAAGAMLTTLVTLNYHPIDYVPLAPEKQVGGLRVNKIATSNPGESPMIKKYFYGTMEDLNTSSLHISYKPNYLGITLKETPCNGDLYACNYSTLNSSSITNLGVHNGSPISYSSVVESSGENFEGGGTESKFYTGADGLGEIIWGRDIINSPLTNFGSFYNSKPRFETVFKKMSSGILKPIRKTEYLYKNDPAGENTLYGVTVVQRRSEHGSMPDTTCDISINPNETLSCYNICNGLISKYDMIRYKIFSSWVYPETITETLYDEEGNNPVTTTTSNYYENLQNYQLTKTETINSNGQKIRTTLKYPHDFTSNSVYASMVNNNIIAPLVSTKKEIVNTAPALNTPLSEEKVNFGNTGNNNFSPVAVERAVKGNVLELEGTIDQYDNKGNILQMTNKAGIVSAIIWGYNYQYPVAQIVGATYASALAQLTVNIDGLQTLDGAALLTELNRIRTNLPNARVTTYTYKHLAGVTSITDPNNKTNTYQYDGFNRLLIIKDQDGNAVKKNEYLYATPDANTSLTIYLNEPMGQNVQSNSCAPGYAGLPILYVVPPGKYYSFVSQADANAKALTDIQTLGQDYANKKGTCSNSATCTGPGYKFVNCACEQGQKICETSVLHPNGSGDWLNTFHFLWSDGSVSPSFTEVMPPCTGINKKKIGCICETGVKVCDLVVNNNNGTYTVTYHYHFSDNTNSSTVTETIACSGVDKKIINCTCETGVKVYTASVQCGRFNAPAGCCTGQWLCTFHYVWSDGSYSGDYTECSPATCMAVAE